MTRKRTRSKATAAVTGVATGNLGTAANLDDTQVLRTEDLRAAAPEWVNDDDGPLAPGGEPEMVPPAPVPPVAVAPTPASAPAYEVAPSRPAAARTSPSPGSAPRDRRRGLALAGVGAFAVLVVLAGAGILSQLDLGFRGTGGEASFPAFGFTTAPAPAATPESQAGGGKGHGHDTCHGRHCN